MGQTFYWLGTKRRFDGIDGAALCVTVSVCPATVRVPTRWLVVVLAVALNVTVPFPVPLVPLPIVSQAALLVAVQLQLVPPVTMTSVLEFPPPELNVRVVGDMPNVQEELLLWVTVTV